MPPKTRNGSFPRVVIERESDSEESSSSDEEEVISEDENVGNLIAEEEELVEEEEEDDMNKKKKMKGKAPITISLQKVCKVCKKSGHEAGFRGATYIDCPMKPCFLCRMPGHTTLNCPHRVATQNGVIPLRSNTSSSLDYVLGRQIKANIAKIKPTFVIPDQVDCGVIRYHSRRITCLEFHPTNNNILLSGDKKGQLGVWDFQKIHEKTVYGNIHSCILNNMKFNPANDGTIYGASSDGTVSCIDLETGLSSQLVDLNPNGWHGPNNWRMLYGMDVNSDKGLVVVADNHGILY